MSEDPLAIILEAARNRGFNPSDQQKHVVDGSTPPPLGNYANNSSPPRPRRPPRTPDPARVERRRGRRRERFGLRWKLRKLTRLERVAACGWYTVGPGGNGNCGPGLRVSPAPSAAGDIAGLSGLASCGSVWACPVCASKIATRRAAELADVMRVALERGCSASLVTLTMRHELGDGLADLWDAVSKAWAAVTSGKQWVTDKARYGLRGWVKAVEVTRGKHGWHVHVHALLIWDGTVPLSEAKQVGRRMWNRWDAELGRRGYSSLRDLGGLDVRAASLTPGAVGGLHEYFVKLAHEISNGQAKLARGGGRTPFQVIADVFDGGEADDVDAWHEWEQASRGRRQIAWSKDLREWAGLGAELTDEEIAAEEIGAEDMLFIAPESWRALRTSPGAVCDLLEAAEDGGAGGARKWLTMHGHGWVMLKQRRRERP